MDSKPKQIIDLYYPALMLFLVFTFADNLLRGIIQCFSLELLLFIIMWLFLTIQTTFAYIRIKDIDPKEYPPVALLSDCLDIIIAIYVCAAIGSVYSRGETHELSSYLHLSVPFVIFSINQFTWFILVRKFDIPAIFRICILFFGMIAASISELINHSFWNLLVVVGLIVLLGILRAIDKAPDLFCKLATRLWTSAKKKV